MQNWSTIGPTDPLWKKLRTGEITDVIFDSGGFQLQTKVETRRVVRLENYALWLELTLRDYPNIKYLSLDIPGNNLQTMENQISLESYGLSPIPIWHLTNSEVYDKALEFYCSEYEYLAIGSIAKTDRRATYRLFEFLMQKYPHMKFHLLGIGTGISEICKIYRPYSADASSWLAPARWGQEILLKGNMLVLEKMSPEESLRIRKNDDVRTEWSRKTISLIKEFERRINDTVPDRPYQSNMFI